LAAISAAGGLALVVNEENVEQLFDLIAKEIY
jgi:hypothetical protein